MHVRVAGPERENSDIPFSFFAPANLPIPSSDAAWCMAWRANGTLVGRMWMDWM